MPDVTLSLVGWLAEHLATWLGGRAASPPLMQSKTIDVPGTAQHFRYFGGFCDKIEGEPVGWLQQLQYRSLPVWQPLLFPLPTPAPFRQAPLSPSPKRASLPTRCVSPLAWSARWGDAHLPGPAPPACCCLADWCLFLRRSSLGTSPSSWPAGSWPPRWPPDAPSCSRWGPCALPLGSSQRRVPARMLR